MLREANAHIRSRFVHTPTHRIASHRVVSHRASASRSRLRNRSAKRTPASPLECISAVASWWFLPLPYPFTPLLPYLHPNPLSSSPSNLTVDARNAKCTRAATRAATHVACRVTTNLAAYVLARKQRRPFICKILTRRKSLAGPRRSWSSCRRAKTRPVVPGEK